MNRQKQTLVIACGLAMSIFAAASNAQVAPPPTKPANDQPTYTPAPKPTPQPASRPNQEPQPQEGMEIRRRDRNNEADLPTDVPYPKLAQTGPDGRIARLRQLPDILALRSNPTVGPKTAEAIMPLVYLRRYKMETSVIDNLDLYWELTNGMIETLNMGDINEMGRAADMIKPLVPEVTLSQDLLNRQILTRVQGGMNKHIVREYKKAITDEIQVLDGEKGLEEVMRFVLDDSLQEAKLAYEGLLVELMSNIGKIVDATDLDSSEVEALAKLEKVPSLDPAEQMLQIEEFDNAFRKLSYDEGMKIFTALRENREFENLSPTISAIDVMHDRKKIMEGDAMGLKITDKRTDEVRFNSVDQQKKQAEQESESDQTDN